MKRKILGITLGSLLLVPALPAFASNYILQDEGRSFVVTSGGKVLKELPQGTVKVSEFNTGKAVLVRKSTCAAKDPVQTGEYYDVSLINESGEPIKDALNVTCISSAEAQSLSIVEDWLYGGFDGTQLLTGWDGKAFPFPHPDYLVSTGKVSEGLLSVTYSLSNSQLTALDRGTLPAVSPENSEFYTGFVNIKGQWVLPPVYEEAKDFHQGLAAIRIGDLWGYINPQGQKVIPATFTDAGDFIWNYAVVGQKGLYGIIDKFGSFTLQPKYLAIKPLNYGFFAVQKEENGPWGIITSQGTQITPLIYTSIGEFSEGLAVAEYESRVGYLNYSGKWAITPQFGFQFHEDFQGGLAKVMKDGEEVLIDKSGKVVYKFKQ